MGRGWLFSKCSWDVDLKDNKDVITPPLVRGYFLLTNSENDCKINNTQVPFPLAHARGGIFLLTKFKNNSIMKLA